MKRAHKPFDLQAALASNPTLRRLNPPKPTLSTVLETFFDKKGIKSHPPSQKASKLLKAHRKQGQGRALHDKFLLYWKLLGGPELEREVRFHAIRKWRWDYALPQIKVALEIDGGTFLNLGHNRGAQISKDHDKRNTATLMGWRVFVLTCDMIRKPNEFIRPIVEWVKAEGCPQQ